MAGGWNDPGRLISPSVSVYSMRPDARPRVEWEAEVARRRAAYEAQLARQRAAERARRQTYMSSAPVRDDRPVLRNLDDVRRAERERATPDVIRSMEQTADSLINPITAIEFARDAGSAAHRVVNSATFGLTGRSEASADDLVLLGSALAMGRVARAPAGRGGKTPGIFRKAFGADATEAARTGRDVAGLTRKVAEVRKVFDSSRAQEAAVKEYRAATAAADSFDRTTSMWLRGAEDAVAADPRMKAMTDQVVQYANSRASSEAGVALQTRLENAAAAIQRTGADPAATAEALAERSRAAAGDLMARMDELKARRAYEEGVYHAPDWVKSANPKGAVAKTVRFMAEQATSKGLGPRMLSYVERGIGGIFGDVQGKPGKFLHAISSPGANAVLLDALALYGIGGYMARKMGWWNPDKDTVESAERGTSGPKVATAVEATALESIRRDYVKAAASDRSAAAQARDAALANMDPAAIAEERGRIRDQVFRIHNPGMTIEGLSGTDKGRAYVERFDNDVFNRRTVNDWITTDLDQYSSEVEARRAGGGL